MAYPVKLHVYDLSGGMAKQFSQSFIGKQIDGIWHSGIVVYDYEWYFGGGILSDRPYSTPYGNPLQTFDLGSTDVPIELFKEFLDGIRDRFRMETYHLLDNNCNHFTNECSQFLLGKQIPSHITGLPQEVLNTPFGMMIQPLINSFFSKQGWGSVMGPQQPIQSITNPVNNNNNNLNNNYNNNNNNVQSQQQQQQHPKLNPNHWHYKLISKIPLLLNSKPILFEKGDIDSVFTKLETLLKSSNIDQQLYSTNSKQLLSIIKNQAITTPVPTNLLKYLDETLLNVPNLNPFPIFEIIRFLLLKNDGMNYYTVNGNTNFIPQLVDKLIAHSYSKESELIAFRILVNLFSNSKGIQFIINNQKLLSNIVDATVAGIHSNDSVLKRAVSTMAYNLSLYLNPIRHEELIGSLLAATHHILEESPLSQDPEIDFRLLMALGTLILSSDSSIELVNMLGFTSDKYLKSPEQKVKQLVQEINSLLVQNI